MKVLHMLFFLLACLFCLQDATSEASGITTREGKNVTLPCKTSNGQSGIWYKTVWFKGLDRVIFIGNGGHFIIYSQRKHPITVVDKESIRLDYVDRYDHGNYSCRALYSDGSDPKNVQQNVTLLVKARPLISTKSPRIQNLTHNASKPNLALDCTVKAFPKADATWQKIDGQLPKSRIKQESNGTLVIHEASAEDSGTYQCSAVNELGRDQLNFTVAVFEPPRIFGKKKFHANVDETAELICESRGNPNLSFSWTWRNSKNKTFSIAQGEELSGYSMTTKHGTATSQSILKIITVKEESWTLYTCEAVNALGRSSANISLSGKTRPESPTIISVETTDREALVTWTFNDDGGLELNALILQYRKGEKEWNEIQIKPPNKNKYTIMYLDPDTNYNFRILATNNLGTSTPSSNYFAKTKKTDIDECKEGYFKCPENAKCKNTPGSYDCLCEGGFRYNAINNTCDDIDECKEGYFKCRENAKCKNTLGSYDCLCEGGFRYNAINDTCDDIDECESRFENNCYWSSAECINTPGSYYCRCPHGYKYDDRERRCKDDKNRTLGIIFGVIFGVVVVLIIIAFFFHLRNKRYKAELQDDNNASFTTRSVHSGVTFPEDSKEDRKRTSSYELQSRPMYGNLRPESRTSGDYDYPDPQPTGTRESFPYYDNPGLQKDHTQ